MIKQTYCDVCEAYVDVDTEFGELSCGHTDYEYELPDDDYVKELNFDDERTR